MRILVVAMYLHSKTAELLPTMDDASQSRLVYSAYWHEDYFLAPPVACFELPDLWKQNFLEAVGEFLPFDDRK
jgi:hypothetical protein